MDLESEKHLRHLAATWEGSKANSTQYGPTWSARRHDGQSLIDDLFPDQELSTYGNKPSIRQNTFDTDAVPRTLSGIGYWPHNTATSRQNFAPSDRSATQSAAVDMFHGLPPPDYDYYGLSSAQAHRGGYGSGGGCDATAQSPSEVSVGIHSQPGSVYELWNEPGPQPLRRSYSYNPNLGNRLGQSGKATSPRSREYRISPYGGEKPFDRWSREYTPKPAFEPSPAFPAFKGQNWRNRHSQPSIIPQSTAQRSPDDWGFSPSIGDRGPTQTMANSMPLDLDIDAAGIDEIMNVDLSGFSCGDQGVSMTGAQFQPRVQSDVPEASEDFNALDWPPMDAGTNMLGGTGLDAPHWPDSIPDQLGNHVEELTDFDFDIDLGLPPTMQQDRTMVEQPRSPKPDNLSQAANLPMGDNPDEAIGDRRSDESTALEVSDGQLPREFNVLSSKVSSKSPWMISLSGSPEERIKGAPNVRQWLSEKAESFPFTDSIDSGGPNSKLIDDHYKVLAKTVRNHRDEVDSDGVQYLTVWTAQPSGWTRDIPRRVGGYKTSHSKNLEVLGHSPDASASGPSAG